MERHPDATEYDPDADRPAEGAGRGDDAARSRLAGFDEALLTDRHDMDSDGLARFAADGARLIDGWDAADPVKNKYLLERIGRSAMQVYGAPSAPIVAVERPENELGVYRDGEFVTEINSKLLSSDDARGALETYLHEYRHTAQNAAVSELNTFAYPDSDTRRTEALARNLKDYVRPTHEGDSPADAGTRFEDYAAQLVERDAEKNGVSIADSILERREKLVQIENALPRPSGVGDAAALSRLRGERD